jgi:hypothetical protein
MTAAEERWKREREDLETRIRNELVAKLTAEKDAALEEARQAADAELRALEKMSDLQLADMMRERNKAREDAEKFSARLDTTKIDHERAIEALRAEHASSFGNAGQEIARLEHALATETARREAAEQRLTRDREILTRARDSLAEAMRSVDIARDPDQKV